MCATLALLTTEPSSHHIESLLQMHSQTWPVLYPKVRGGRVDRAFDDPSVSIPCPQCGGLRHRRYVCVSFCVMHSVQVSAGSPGLGTTRDCTWTRIFSVESRMFSSCRERSSSSVSNSVTLSAFPSFSTVYWRKCG